MWAIDQCAFLNLNLYRRLTSERRSSTSRWSWLRGRLRSKCTCCPSRSNSSCPSYILFIVERYIWSCAKIGIQVPEISCTSTRNCIFRVRAGERELVEYSLVTAHERILEHFLCSVWIDNCVANMEDLTIVILISIITISTTHERSPNCTNNEFCSIREFICCTL